MILVDTNIISELMRQTPSPLIIAWLNEQNSMELFVSSITIAEITYGLKALPTGKRKALLEKAFAEAIHEAFNQRILSFDEKAAYVYGEIMSLRKAIGQPLSVPDGQIAAIALVHGFLLATRNISDFVNCGIKLINPFENCPQSIDPSLR